MKKTIKILVAVIITFIIVGTYILLFNQINVLEKRIDTIEGNNTNDVLKTQIVALNEELEVYDNKIKTIENKISKLETKNNSISNSLNENKNDLNNTKNELINIKNTLLKCSNYTGKFFNQCLVHTINK